MDFSFHSLQKKSIHVILPVLSAAWYHLCVFVVFNLLSLILPVLWNIVLPHSIIFLQVWPVVLMHHGRKLWNIGYIFCRIESIDILFYPKLNCKSKVARCRPINWKSILNYARKILRMREFCCRHYDYHYYTVSSSLLLLLCQLLKHLRGGSSTYIAKMIK